MDEIEELHQKIYNVICLTGNIPLYDFNLNTVINEGKYAFCGVEAENLIFNSADAIGLPIDYFSDNFPFSKYFEDEGNPLLLFILPLLIIVSVILYILLLFKCNLFKQNEIPPLTAEQFADIMIEIWEQYQKENKK